MNILKQLFWQKITLTEQNNIITLTIKEELSLKEFINYLEKTKYSYLLNIIDLKHLTKDNSIPPKKIITFNKNNITYIISISKNIIKISKKRKQESITEETIEIDKQNYTYIISKLIHNLDGSTQEVKIYNKDQSKNHKLFLLPKESAIAISKNILEELSLIEEIATIININELFKILNLIPNKDYHPIIGNDTIILSWKDKYGSTDIYIKTRATLDILLYKTKEKIGEITFNYMYNKNSNYAGNVGYHIESEFQNNHYATEALALLKELLKQHKYKGDKDLYISADINNIRSQKVAQNNNGELYYEGEIPNNDPLSRHSGITHIKMYRIKI